MTAGTSKRPPPLLFSFSLASKDPLASPHLLGRLAVGHPTGLVVIRIQIQGLFWQSLAKTQSFHCREQGFNSQSGNQDPICRAAQPEKETRKRKGMSELEKNERHWEDLAALARCT